MRKEQVYGVIEKVLWSIRYLIFVPIFFLCISLVYMLVLMGERLIDATDNLVYDDSPFEVLIYLIDIVDFTLICVIMLIIIWGVYELFIRDMQVGIHHKVKADSMLIHDIDELKQKLGKVIIISLVVHLFKQMLVMDISTSLDMVYVCIGAVLLAGALFLIEKTGSKASPHKNNIHTGDDKKMT